jgi:signal transduction histidine kinase
MPESGLISRFKAAVSRHWPVMRLRWVLFGTLLFVAALPGVGAVWLRVYENALVRRTEAELVAQSSALVASAALMWPGAPHRQPPDDDADAGSRREEYEVTPTEIDLRSSTVLPERPPATPGGPPDASAIFVMSWLRPAFAETKRATLASILMLDSHGVLVNGPETGGSLAALPEVRRALAGSPTTVLRHNDAYRHDTPLEWLSRATSIRLHHARPIVVNDEVVGVILVSRSPSALFRGMWEDRGKIAIGVGVIFLALLVLTAILARAIVRPVENLSRATRALAEGRRTDFRRPSLQVLEIRSLFDDFAVMAQSIERRSRYLRDFAASLSHEFKTPLAGIRGGIELLQDHGDTMSPGDRERFLANMAVDSDRLSRLVSRLMELAQADMGADGEEASADLSPILARLSDGMAGPDFAIAIDEQAKLPRLAMQAGALETVLATLIENARQAGAAHLTITARSDGDQVRMDIADDGPGIPPGDRDRVFDPFFTSKREKGGTGLGLPIARALVGNSRGWLELAASEVGARFVLSIGRADR